VVQGLTIRLQMSPQRILAAERLRAPRRSLERGLDGGPECAGVARTDGLSGELVEPADVRRHGWGAQLAGQDEHAALACALMRRHDDVGGGNRRDEVPERDEPDARVQVDVPLRGQGSAAFPVAAVLADDGEPSVRRPARGALDQHVQPLVGPDLSGEQDDLVVIARVPRPAPSPDALGVGLGNELDERRKQAARPPAVDDVAVVLREGQVRLGQPCAHPYEAELRQAITAREGVVR
jgi:hypothetical protein